MAECRISVGSRIQVRDHARGAERRAALCRRIDAMVAADQGANGLTIASNFGESENG
jgi:hypothetical protein